jgi:hypothetical protein
MLKAEWIKEKIVNGHWYISRHCDEDRQKDGISIDEIETALMDGVILEQYADTGRGDSCLVGGFVTEGKPIHVVCGRRGNSLMVITVYVPKPPRFKNPWERG